MKLGAILSPVVDTRHVIEAARAADEAGLDAVGLWDHYHSPRPEWGYAAGWSLLGAVAAATERVRIVPMVLNNLHYQLGVLAKESSILALASGGRFELGIGAGDWPASFPPWGEAFPPAEERLGRLTESVAALRALWAGEPVGMDGRWVHLDGAVSTPPPAVPPRVVVGVGGSRRTLEVAQVFADELNVYTGPGLIEEASAVVRADGLRPDVSVFLSWEWDKWPADPAAELRELERRGASRAFVSLGADLASMVQRISELAATADA
jgi:alkanesulfonate monooxygenase SsuD/methylene tetrahydromethanopterin reductase-like flavin-dependent oxidoreductase (luciferase family)